jgi:hypothetical protein
MQVCARYACHFRPTLQEAAQRPTLNLPILLLLVFVFTLFLGNLQQIVFPLQHLCRRIQLR